MQAAVIGVGRMGRRHLGVLRDLDISIGGVCDQAAESRALAQSEFALGDHQVFAEAAALLAAVAPDLVIVATTAPAHTEYTRLALAHGARYVLCEKPLVTCLRDADALIALAADRGAHLAVNHYLRYSALGVTLRDLIATDEFGGALTSMTISAANIGMAMVGSHYLDLFQQLTLSPLATVQAWLERDPLPNPRGVQFEDRGGALRVVTENGQRLYLEAGVDQGHGVKVVIGGRNGQITVDPFAGRVWLSTRQAANRDLPTTRYGTPSDDTMIEIAPLDAVVGTRAVIEALISGAGYPTAGEARAVIAALAAAYASDEADHRAIAVSAAPLDRVFAWA